MIGSLKICVSILCLTVVSSVYSEPIELRLSDGSNWRGNSENVVIVTTTRGNRIGKIEKVSPYNITIRTSTTKTIVIDKQDVIDVRLHSAPPTPPFSEELTSSGLSNQQTLQSSEHEYDPVISNLPVHVSIVPPIDLTAWEITGVKPVGKNKWFRTPQTLYGSGFRNARDIESIQIKWSLRRGTVGVTFQIGDDNDLIPLVSLLADEKIHRLEASLGAPKKIFTQIVNKKHLSNTATIEMLRANIGFNDQPRVSSWRIAHSTTSLKWYTSGFNNVGMGSDPGGWDGLDRPGGAEEMMREYDRRQRQEQNEERRGRIPDEWPFDISPRLLEQSWKNVLPHLTERALRPFEFVVVLDNERVVRSRLTIVDDELRLRAISSESLEDSTLFDNQLKDDVLHSVLSIEGFLQHHELASSASPIPVSVAQDWKNYKLLTQHDVRVNLPCRHETARGIYNATSPHPEICPGCLHNPRCNGNKKTCAACSENKTKRHYMTGKEARAMKGMIEAQTAYAASGTITEIGLDQAPCYNHKTISRIDILRRWEMDVSLYVGQNGELDPSIGKCVQVEVFQHPECQVEIIRIGESGKLEASFSIIGFEQLPKKDAVENPDSPQVDLFNDGKLVVRPVFVLADARFVFINKEGILSAFKYNPTKGVLEPVLLSYLEWQEYSS